jgi:hypothetical protein
MPNYGRLFSRARLERYYDLYPNAPQKAIEYYLINIQLSEAIYPVLAI